MAEADIAFLANSVSYTGNPDHKRNPRDFGLQPPLGPRPHKTLCDDANIRDRKTALDLLRAGVCRGLVSEQSRGEFPQNVWAVTPDGVALEAQLDNREKGSYHGYPKMQDDGFREKVLAKWHAT